MPLDKRRDRRRKERSSKTGLPDEIEWELMIVELLAILIGIKQH